jgi:hypothetical protein
MPGENPPFLERARQLVSPTSRSDPRTSASIVTGRSARAAGACDAIESRGRSTPTVKTIAVFFILPCIQALLLWGKSSSLRSLTIQKERLTASATFYAGRGLLIVSADDGNWAEQLMYAEYIDR